MSSVYMAACPKCGMRPRVWQCFNNNGGISHNVHCPNGCGISVIGYENDSAALKAWNKKCRHVRTKKESRAE